MNAIPGYNYSAYNCPYPPMQQKQQPTASAVTINVIEPKAYAGCEPVGPGPYYYPQTSVYNQPGVMYPMQYNMPQTPQYYPQQAPQYYPQMPQQFPPQQYPQMPYPDPNQQMPQQYPPQQYPQMPYPDPNQQVPQQPPVIPETQNQPVPQNPNEPPQLTVNDLPAINAALAQENDNVKGAAIEAVAKIGQGDPDTFKNLINVVTTDTSKLNGDAKQSAETNRKHAMWALALLNKNQNPQVPLTELPGGADIAKTLSSDANPEMRKAALAALDFLAKPEDANLLKQMYTIVSKRDKNPEVKALAEQALNNLNQQSVPNKAQMF